MKISQHGIDKIKSREGLVLHVYPDPATGGAPWTIGYGSTGPSIKPGLVITEAQAEEMLKADLAKFESCVADVVTVHLTQNQFDALVSFSYNVGMGNLRSSTLLRKLNQGQIEAAANEFLRWNKAAGKVMAGLTRRREDERNQFLTV